MDVKYDRCCMCPQVGMALAVCPGIPGAPHPTPDSCRFVREYADERGTRYKVFGFSGDAAKYKARFLLPNGKWLCLRTLPWRESFDEAQEDLNRYA